MGVVKALGESHSFWEQDAPKFLHERWVGKAPSRFDQEETKIALQRAFQRCHGKLLDIGCGPGFWLTHAIFSRFSFRLGIDRSCAMIRLAQEAGATALLADAHVLPLESNQFDAVMSIHVLEYSPDPRQFLLEARRVLRPGGRCCIITKNKFGRPWQWARWRSEKIAPNPLVFHCLTIDEIGAIWGSAPVEVTWISARLITDLNDVNDAVQRAFPPWFEGFTLLVARFLRPVLIRPSCGKVLAWHVAVLLEKEKEV